MGIAVDWTSGNIYWTDTGSGRIEVASNNGAWRRALIWKDLKRPHLIVLNPAEGHMYWTAARGATIERASMDGRQREPFYSSGGQEGPVSGLAIDVAGQRLYWSTDDSVSFADLKTRQVQTLLKTSAKISGLTVHAGHIYWAEGDRVLRADSSNGRGRTLVLSGNAKGVTDLLVFDAKFTRDEKNPCQER